MARFWRTAVATVTRFLFARSPGALGKAGEEAAARHLEQSGYRVLARNYRIRGGEADLIAEKGGFIVAVEVKSRATQTFGTPAQAVTSEKARRVLRAGRAYCRSQGISLAKLRCDVMAVEPDPEGKFALRHYPNAFGEPPKRRR